MQDFRPIWKDLAVRKDITAADMVSYHTLRAMHCEDEFEEQVSRAQHWIKRSFTPSKTSGYKAMYDAIRMAKYNVKRSWGGPKVLGVKLDEVFDNEEEIERFCEILAKVD